METELIEMPRGLFAAIKNALAMSTTPASNADVTALMNALASCNVLSIPDPEPLQAASE